MTNYPIVDSIFLKDKKIYLYIDPICLSPLDEGRPQPIVDIWVADVTDNVAPPVDPLVKVGEALLNPACDEKQVGQISWLNIQNRRYIFRQCVELND